MKSQKAFTLAETLITLVIIGVIAALTVPNLIIKYQKEQTVTKLKKVYSTLSQTTNRAIADNGPVNTWEIGRHLNADDTKKFLNKYMIPYLSVISKPTTFNEGHWNKTIYFLNGTTYNCESGSVRFYLNDGASVTSQILNYGSADTRLVINIDINGDKKPNRFGRDIFEFIYWFKYPNHEESIGKFISNGIELSRNDIMNQGNYSCNKSKYGTKCSALIMKDGWKISDDYPW